ncbi:MAG TPA: hypothetical protein VEU30_03360 [Thermoanaerobaculia bacterium]|nr:hypothetical protein [Thermoanaerobaculia bacterium]
MKALTARLDDWINPIAMKELRQAVRGKFVMVALILSLLAQLVTVAVLSIMTALQGNPQAAGPGAFTVIFSVVFTAGIFFVPMYTGFRMAAERSDANVDLLFITTIRPRTIVFGKLQAVAGIVVLLYSASLPFLVFSYVLRGVDFVTIGILLALAMAVVISQSIVALFIGALPTSRPFKILLAIGFFFGTFAVYAPVLGFASELLRFGTPMIAGAPQFWLLFASFAAIVVTVDAMLLVLTTAMITPAAANRALPIRVMMVVVWLLSFAPPLWAAIEHRADEGLLIWAIAQLALITIVLLSATSERESWGARVARTIPKNPKVRPLAFLFYSGAAGGTIWSVLMYAATILVYWRVGLATKSLTAAQATTISTFLIDGAVAMLAYAMTAVLLRRTLLKRVPASRTWGLALGVFMLLTVLPPIAILTRDAEAMDWTTYVHITTLANPFPTMQRPEELQLARTLFLVVWAALVTSANAPWFLAQIQKFKPSTRQPDNPTTPTTQQPSNPATQQPIPELASE